jgi:diacylglycerol O-acyltransferase-1
MIRLDDDPGWVILRNDPFDDAANAHHTRQSVQDCPFRVADMTGRKVQLAQVEWGDRPEGAMLAYLRAVPTSQARLERVRSRGDKRLVAMNDGHGIFYMGVAEPEELWYFILPYRDSGYRSMLFCISGADHCNYPTEVGSLEGEGLDDFPTAGYRRYTESLAGLMRRGIDPIATVRDMCRSIGLEFHLSIRMGAFAMEPPYDGVFISRFYRRHPELRCIDHDGRAISRLSYAFPDVRRHVLAIVDELLAYRPDGINFIFPRAQPFVLYEEPFLQRFRSLHGTDPRELPEDDRDVLDLRAAIMSEFMAEARSRTRKHGAELSALVLSDRRSNELHGLDVVRWAREGLLDEIHHLKLRGWHRGMATMMVFFLSAFFHEYLVSIPLLMLRPWAFTAMLFQIPLGIITAIPFFKGQLGNVIVWSSIVLGQPVAILMYMHDYYWTNLHNLTYNGTTTGQTGTT